MSNEAPQPSSSDRGNSSQEGPRSPQEQKEQSPWLKKAYEFYKDQFSANDVGLQAIQRKISDIDEALSGGTLPQWLDGAWQHKLNDLRSALSIVLDETRARMVEKQQSRGQQAPPEPESLPVRADEAQPAVGDWRDNLPAEQRQRVQDYEGRLADADPAELQSDLSSLRSAQEQYRRTKQWPAGHWADQKDAAIFRRVIEERIARLTHRQETHVELEDLLEHLSSGARAHIQSLQRRLQQERRGETVSFLDVIELVQKEYQKAALIGRNLSVEILPPSLKAELMDLFGLPAQIPIKSESIPIGQTGRRVRRNG